MGTMRSNYLRDGVACFVDRCRGYLVPATPEEEVRQDTLDWLIDEHKIPAHLVRSEFHTARRGGRGRADIVVLAPGSNDHEGDAVLVVECKRTDMFVDSATHDQAINSAETVGATYVVVTNGDLRIALAKDKRRWRILTKVPSWREMLAGRGLRWLPDRRHAREAWNRIDTHTKCRALIRTGSPYEFVVGADTPGYLVPFAFSLFGCFAFDRELRLPLEDDRIELARDLGVKSRWFGNSAGGTWPSEYYRSILVRDKATNSHKVVSLSVLAGAKNVNDPVFGNTRGMTYLIVAIDDGRASHVSLEMALDKFVNEGSAIRENVTLRHNGTMTAGRRGRVANDAVVSFVRRKGPHLVDTGSILLGTLPSDRLITWNDARDFLLRVIRYALVRDEIRVELRRAAESKVRPLVSWKHGDIVSALYDGKPHEPARFIRMKGKTQAWLHWYDGSYSVVRIKDILGSSSRQWSLHCVEEDVDLSDLVPVD